MDKKNQRNGENFFLGAFIYLVIVVCGRFLLSLFDNIIITFTPAKPLTELKTDPSFLFNITYPFLAFFTLILFYGAVFGLCYFAGYKLAYKFDSTNSKSKILIQMILIVVFVFGYSVIQSVVEGNILPVFWYCGAFWGNIFGAVDPVDAFSKISTYDFSSVTYIINGITPQIGGFIIVSELLTGIATFFTAFYARKLGAKVGISNRLKLREELFKNSPRNI